MRQVVWFYTKNDYKMRSRIFKRCFVRPYVCPLKTRFFLEVPIRVDLFKWLYYLMVAYLAFLSGAKVKSFFMPQTRDHGERLSVNP